jgi:hypothetical protein
LNNCFLYHFSEYPPYQNFILENHFLQVAVDIAKSDSESYVRASALTFISTAVRINSLWDKLLNQLNLLVHLKNHDNYFYVKQIFDLFVQSLIPGLSYEAGLYRK